MCSKIILSYFIFLGYFVIVFCNYQCIQDDYKSFQNCYKNIHIKLHDTGDEKLNMFHRMDIRCSLVSKIFECLDDQRKKACDNTETKALHMIFNTLSPVHNPSVSCNNTGIIKHAMYKPM